MRSLYTLLRHPSFPRFKIKNCISLNRSISAIANTGRGPFAALARALCKARQRQLSSALDSTDSFFVRIWRGVKSVSTAIADSIHVFYTEQEQRQVGRVGAVALLGAFTVVMCTFSAFNFGLNVTINGQYMGYVTNRAEVDEIILQAEKHISDYTGTPYMINANVSYSLTAFESGTPLDLDDVRNMLFTSVPQPTQPDYYEFSVNGEVLGIYKSREALEMLLVRIAREQAGSDGNDKLGFAEDISIVPVKASAQDLSDMAELEALLRSERKGTEYYTIKRGDTPSEIAQEFGLTIAQLKKLNPDYDLTTIYIGDVLVISDRVPFLTVTTTVLEEFSETVEFDILNEYNPELYVNESYLKRSGTDGEAFVVADVEYANGEVIGRTVYSYTITTEPTAQINVVGSKPLPAKVATGTFIPPTKGTLTSKTGYRPRFGDTHTGIDLANSQGTIIWAADGGTVIHAGWLGNYGYCVKIDHGNGYVTYYAHNSEVLVEVGQKVAQHETIALMGSTGKSTGPHCHFEIRYNGKWQNPLNYITLD